MLLYNFLGKTVTFEVVAELRPEWRTSNSAFTPTSRRLLRQLQELDPDTIYTVTQQFEFSYTLVDGDVQLNITSVNNNVIDEDTTSFKVEDYYPSSVWFTLHIVWVSVGIAYNFTSVFKLIPNVFMLGFLRANLVKIAIQVIIRLSYATFLLEIIFKDSEWESVELYNYWFWTWVVPSVYFIAQEVVKTMITNITIVKEETPESVMDFFNLRRIITQFEAPSYLTFIFTGVYTALIMAVKDPWVENIASSSAIGIL